VAHLDRCSGFSDAARTRHGHDAVPLEEVDQCRDVGVPPEEGRSRIREVARQACESLTLALQEVRGRDRQSIGRDREDLKRATDILELESPQVHEPELWLIPDLIVDRVRHQDSPGYPEGLDAGSDVDRVPDKTGGLDDHIADVDADPHGNVRRLAELLLDLDRAQDGIQ
jgi:hypothetical protein